MFCTRCGSPVNPNDTACARCGQIAVRPATPPGAYPTNAHPTNAYPPNPYPTAPPGAPQAAPPQMSFNHNVSYHSRGTNDLIFEWFKTKPYAKAGIIAILLVSLFGFLRMGVSLVRAGSTPSTARSGVQQPAPPPAAPVIPTGPSFSEADSRLDSRKHDLTEAQKDAYWKSIEGTMVQWTGEVVSVDSERGGTISLKCNPKTWSSDVYINLDGSQVNRLYLINKGQQLTVKGILRSYGMTGYNLDQGQVQNL